MKLSYDEYQLPGTMGFEFLLRASESVNEGVNWNTKWKWKLRDLWRLTTLKKSMHA